MNKRSKSAFSISSTTSCYFYITFRICSSMIRGIDGLKLCYLFFQRIAYKEFDLIWGRFDLIWGRVCVNICRANLVFHYHISMVSPHYVTVVVVVVV